METHAEENYLKVIYNISEDHGESVSTKMVAELVRSKPSSVTDMIQRLSGKKLVNYKKYRGVSLTEKGQKKALYVIRKHRLWEYFLVNHLHFSWNEVHEIAEQLEHVCSPLLVRKLDAFLNYPTRDPHGDIIPDENGKTRIDNTLVLGKVDVDQICFVSCIRDSSSDFLVYLDSIGIGLDTGLQVLESFPYDNSKKIKIIGKSTLSLSGKVCNNLYVRLNKNEWTAQSSHY